MSIIKVNEIQKRTGSTLTLGGACTAVTLAPGATQSGFGRTGTVDWCTTAKTSPFTAASGDGFFLNTNGGAITVTLPSSPSQGDIVAFKDYLNTWDDACKAVTLCRNGSKIGGQCANAKLDAEGQSVTLIYVDNTRGWIDIHDSNAKVTGELFVTATGGTITTSGNFKIHTFTGDGNFVVSCAGNSGGSNTVDYMVVAGGAGGGRNGTGGGGAGGFRASSGTASGSYTAGPASLVACVAALPVTATSFPVVVGGGGAGVTSGCGPGTAGSTSSFSTISSAGGGGGGGPNPNSGVAGGSGGGAGRRANPTGGPGAAGAGNTPPVSPPQGNPGGTFSSPSGDGGGAGGGAGGAGGNGVTSSGPGAIGGAGGAGVTTCISASPVTFAGGGGGGSDAFAGTGGAGGSSVGGTGGGGGPPGTVGSNATANRGSGGGGGGNGAAGGNGSGGTVIIRYKFQ